MSDEDRDRWVWVQHETDLTVRHVQQYQVPGLGIGWKQIPAVAAIAAMRENA